MIKRCLFFFALTLRLFKMMINVLTGQIRNAFYLTPSLMRLAAIER
jgi:hypothetical protein